VINEVVPETIGGSADLTGSNNTKTSQTAAITAQNFSGRWSDPIITTDSPGYPLILVEVG